MTIENDNVNTQDTDYEAQMTSLKQSRDQVLGEKKALQSQLTSLKSLLDSVGGEEGISQLQELRNKAESDEQKKLLEQGKFNEALSFNEKQLTAKYESQLKQSQKERDAFSKDLQEYKAKYREKLVTDTVKDISSGLGLADSAYKDISMHVMNKFSFEGDTPVIYESEGIKKLNSKGDIYGIKDFINDARQEYTHWNKPSTSGYARGGNASAGNVDYERMSNADVMKHRAKLRGL